MKKTLLSLGCVLAITAAMAQMAPVGSNLTIFSEEGFKFYLILNGERQNDKPETNIRVEDLTQPYYNCKIIFDDKSMGEVSKNMLPVRDAENALCEVTYKIKRDKKGAQVLRYFSSTPLVTYMPPPPGVVTYHFGNPVAVTTTTTSVTTTGGTAVQTGGTSVHTTGVGIDMPGVNINIPPVGVTVTETHTQPVQTQTTYTTTTTTTNTPPPVHVVAQGGGCLNAYPMAPRNFEDAKAAITNADFEETKVTTAKQIVGNNCLTADQVSAICRLFSFEQSKLDFAKYAYGHCVDPGSYFKVNSVFDFDASKSELSKYTSR